MTLPGLGLPPNGVNNIAHAEAGPSMTEEAWAGQQVKSRPLGARIYKRHPSGPAERLGLGRQAAMSVSQRA
jgi:hypothetical protein